MPLKMPALVGLTAPGAGLVHGGSPVFVRLIKGCPCFESPQSDSVPLESAIAPKRPYYSPALLPSFISRLRPSLVILKPRTREEVTPQNSAGRGCHSPY